MTNLTELLGDIECYLAEERKRYCALAESARIHGMPGTQCFYLHSATSVHDLSDRVRAALVELDEQREAL